MLIYLKRWHAHWLRIEHLIRPDHAIARKVTSAAEAADSGQCVEILSTVHATAKDELDEIA